MSFGGFGLNQSQSGIYIDTGLGSAANTVIPANAGIQGIVLNELQGIDSYVGEITGDGVRLMFDYGRYGWNLTPEDEPEHEYIVSFEDIGGREAKLLLAVDSPSNSTTATYEAATGVHFGGLDSNHNLTLEGRGLTREQQRVAVAIFRSIRLPE